MIPGALVGYIVARIFGRDTKLGAAISELALFTIYFAATTTIISEIWEWLLGCFFDDTTTNPNPTSKYNNRR